FLAITNGKGQARGTVRRGRRILDADRTALHEKRSVSLCGYRVPRNRQRTEESRWEADFPARRLSRARAVEPGCGRHSGTKISPQGGGPFAAEARRGESRAVLALAVRAGCPRACEAARGRALWPGDGRAAGFQPHGGRLDLLGLEGRLFLR